MNSFRNKLGQSFSSSHISILQINAFYFEYYYFILWKCYCTGLVDAFQQLYTDAISKPGELSVLNHCHWLEILNYFSEPTTSRASLNFQETLSRPPLNRTHLQFPSLDGSPALGGSSSLFSQPSTSTAPFSGSPFAVTSNFSLVKEIKDSSSQHEDDNISTTSGFSSRASDKGEQTHFWAETAS